MKISEYLNQSLNDIRCLFCDQSLYITHRCTNPECKYSFIIHSGMLPHKLELIINHNYCYYRILTKGDNKLIISKLVEGDEYNEYCNYTVDYSLTIEEFPELKKLRKYINLQFLK